MVRDAPLRGAPHHEGDGGLQIGPNSFPRVNGFYSRTFREPLNLLSHFPEREGG